MKITIHGKLASGDEVSLTREFPDVDFLRKVPVKFLFPYMPFRATWLRATMEMKDNAGIKSMIANFELPESVVSKKADLTLTWMYPS